MKKTLFIISIVVNVSITLNINAQKCSTAEKKKAIEEEIELLQAQAKLDSLKRVLSIIRIELPCGDKALDTDSNYITGFGIGEPQINPASEAEARRNAVSNAKLEINRKWMGSINSIAEDYYYRTSDKSEDKEKFRETLSISGEKAINDFIKETCSQLVEKRDEKRTSITYYYAAKVPISKITSTIIEECEKKGIKVDEAKVKRTVKLRAQPEIYNK